MTVLDIISVGFYVPCGVFSIPHGVESTGPQSTVTGDTFESQPSIDGDKAPSIILFPEQAIRAMADIFLRDMVEGMIVEDEVLQNTTTGSSLLIATDGTGGMCRPVPQKTSNKSSDPSCTSHGREVKDSTDIKVLHRLIADLQYDGCTNLKINIIAGLFQLAARCSHLGRYTRIK